MKLPRLPWIGFMVATVALYATLWRYPGLMNIWGIRLNLGHWVVDLNVLLAASDANALGQPVPLWYSDWWLHLHSLGLTAADSRWLGMSLVLVFLATTLLLLRPQNIPEAVYFALAVCSPPVLLGANRANVDLLIFCALAFVGWLLVQESRAGRALAPFLIGFLTGLKFYPVVAAAALPFVRRSRREIWLTLGGMAALAVLLAFLLFDDFQRARRLIVLPLHLYVFGAKQLFPDGTVGLFPALAPLLAGAALVAFWWRQPMEIAVALDQRAVVMFSLGASTVVGCFFAGVSYNYRLVLSLLMLPLLFQLHREAPRGLVRMLANAALAGLVLLLWMDGFTCIIINLWNGPVPHSAILACRQLFYGLASWIWVGAVLGLWVTLARPVCRHLLGDGTK